MPSTVRISVVALSVVLLAACAGPGLAPDGNTGSPADVEAELAAVPQFPSMPVCTSSDVPGEMHCHAQVRTDDQGRPKTTGQPQGLTPADLQSAYNLPSSGGAGAWIAIVDANDNPNAEADLAVYRQQFGLPPCSSANGCFKKVNQNGEAGSYPTPDEGWAMEIALDLDMASAACPDCRILLVEASSATTADLGAAVNTAATLGAAVISNSWGGSEDGSIQNTDTQYFNHPGIAIFASAGDNGYGAQYPAASAFVTSVGGTKLVKSSSNPRGWIEGAWGSANNAHGGTGSGCSGFIAKPGWQKDTGCSNRTVSDVSAVADPNTGAAVYDSYGKQAPGWLVAGGTSAASPFVAGIWALTGHAQADASLSYVNPSAFNDVVTGSNGSCSPSYLCNAGPGFDGPTGNGTPNGAALAALNGAGGGH